MSVRTRIRFQKTKQVTASLAPSIMSGLIATTIHLDGSLKELVLPKKTADVLEWLRKKLKQPSMQFQGKIVHEECAYAVFGAPAEDDDEEDTVNQHMLPQPFHDDSFKGTLVLLKTKTLDGDEYEKPASAYVDLCSNEYDEFYASCTFDDKDEEDDAVGDEEDGADGLDVEEEEEEAVPTQEHREVPEVAIIHASNVFVDHPLRDLVRERFESEEIERGILARCEADAKKWLIDIDWENPVFKEMYRSRAIDLYRYRDLLKNMSVEEFVDSTPVDQNPRRWRDILQAIIEKEKAMYTKKATASIFMYCSACKRKTKCDYYQMQTRSADEPMTTFVTCLECDKRWKF